MSRNHVLWKEAFTEELDVIRPGAAQDKDKNLVGLAISGGGIRSATFALGVLEGLKHHKILPKIDYLSTVSGGGYIGAWLSANCKRAADHGQPGWLEKSSNWKLSIDHLRRYSNYLSPTVGFFSADTWAMGAIWFRNTILVQLTVIFAIAVALLIPRPLFVVFQHWYAAGNLRWTTIILFIFGVVGIAGNHLRLGRNPSTTLLHSKHWRRGLAGAAVCLALALWIGIGTHFEPFYNTKVDAKTAVAIALLLLAAGFLLQPVAVRIVKACWRGPDPPEQVNYTQAWVQYVVVIPMMATGLLVAAVLWGQSLPNLPNSSDLAQFNTFAGFFGAAWQYWPFPLAVVFSSLWLLSCCAIRDHRDWKCWAVALTAPIPATVVLHGLICGIMLLMHGWALPSAGAAGRWMAYIWGPPMVLYAFSFTVVILIGMLGRQSCEGVREWWSRFGAWLGIYGFAWMLFTSAVAYGPQLSAALFLFSTWGVPVSGGWIATTLAGLFAGNSESTGQSGEKSLQTKVLDILARVAPFIFIAGLLVAVSTVLHLIIASYSALSWNGAAELHSQHWNLLENARLKGVLGILVGCGLTLLLLAARVDINEFSLNAFYRSRLVRCYLGATRFRPHERHPQNFTGFDEKDDLELAHLSTNRPFHIVNCALNLGGSKDLALHTRHSAIFTLTPLRCGTRYISRDQQGEAHEIGYTRTSTFGGRDGQPTLGQAISVSGAAASPNMGYHTSPVVAFLLTLFNVRLGWWFPNPQKLTVKNPSPWFSLRYLFMELFGGAGDKASYLAISDGGHFENLASYELINRKCRVIIISDAECDPLLQFEGLGSLIRMCHVDFGARIEIDVSAIRSGVTRRAVGRIEYEDGSAGILIYLKASMTGEEATDILQYKAAHPAFPQESTGNQFYSEDQFESYRSLGFDIAFRTFELVADQPDIETMAATLASICSPTLHDADQVSRHSTRLMHLWSKLSENPNLDFLDKQFAGSWPDYPEATFRSAFYLCSEMIQLMQSMYLDLRLEDTWDHPDNAGWQTTFQNWAKSPAIQRTWELTAGAYGRRFQYFCHRRLGLQMPVKAVAHAG